MGVVIIDTTILFGIFTSILTLFAVAWPLRKFVMLINRS